MINVMNKKIIESVQFAIYYKWYLKSIVYKNTKTYSVLKTYQ